MERRLGLTVILVLCVVWEANAAVNCTETGAGRFTDGTDTTCKNYTYCVYVSSTGTYVSYNYVCPSTSLFDPDTSKCTTDYVCNVTTSSSNSTNSTVCTEDGYVADSSSTNCSTYIQCVEVNGTFIETTYSCPNGTYFDPNTTLCESNYTCTTNTSSSNTTSTTFTCTSAGRFADSDDTTCKTYYYCVLDSDGSYIQYNYTCPSTSVFSPTAKVCTTSYTCSSS